MKALLLVTSVIEAGVGLALMLAPSLPVSMLLGAALEAPAAIVAGRVAGAALLSLGVACWLARGDSQSRAAAGLIAAMLLYDAAVVAILVHAGVSDGLVGVALWPAVVVHTAMAVWCLACLRGKWPANREPVHSTTTGKGQP